LRKCTNGIYTDQYFNHLATQNPVYTPGLCSTTRGEQHRHKKHSALSDQHPPSPPVCSNSDRGRCYLGTTHCGHFMVSSLVHTFPLQHLQLFSTRVGGSIPCLLLLASFYRPANIYRWEPGQEKDRKPTRDRSSAATSEPPNHRQLHYGHSSEDFNFLRTAN